MCMYDDIPIISSASSNSRNVQLPPRFADNDLLGDEYLLIRNERDRGLYRLLGIDEPSKGSFFATYLIPRAVRPSQQGISQTVAARDSGRDNNILTDIQIDNLAVEVLKTLPQLEKEHPGISDLLSNSKIFRSAGGTLLSPRDLFDPHGAHLAKLLPSSLFPSPQTFSDPSVLHSLRTLGLNSTLTCQGILLAATSIQSEVDASFEAGSAKPRNDAQLRLTIDKAGALLRYLETDIEGLLAEADNEGLEAFKTSSSASTPNSVATSGTMNPTSNAIGGAWGKELRGLYWIPVLTTPPPPSGGKSYEGLPWPEKVHKSPLAAPSQCVQLEDIWFSSSSQRICSLDIRSDILKAVLGWNKGIGGRIAALQLLNIKSMYDTIDVIHERERIQQTFYLVIPSILACLNDAYEKESKMEVDMWTKILQDKPIIWIGGRFVEGSRVAFNSLSSVNTEPYLFVVTGELLKCSPLLRALGVKERFEAADLVSMLRDVKQSFGDAAIPRHRLEVCLGILKLLVRIVNGTNVEGSGALAVEDDDSDDDDDVASNDDVDGVEDDNDGNASSQVHRDSREQGNSDINGEEASAASSVVLRTRSKKGKSRAQKDAEAVAVASPSTAIDIRTLGIIYIPDRNSIMCKATELTYDDAPWISATLNRSSTMKFVHKVSFIMHHSSYMYQRRNFIIIYFFCIFFVVYDTLPYHDFHNLSYHFLYTRPHEHNPNYYQF